MIRLSALQNYSKVVLNILRNYSSSCIFFKSKMFSCQRSSLIVIALKWGSRERMSHFIECLLPPLSPISSSPPSLAMHKWQKLRFFYLPLEAGSKIDIDFQLYSIKNHIYNLVPKKMVLASMDNTTLIPPVGGEFFYNSSTWIIELWALPYWLTDVPILVIISEVSSTTRGRSKEIFLGGMEIKWGGIITQMQELHSAWLKYIKCSKYRHV